MHSDSKIFLRLSGEFGTKQPERTLWEKHQLHRSAPASSDEEENRTVGEGGECQQPRDPEAAGTPQCDAQGRPPPPRQLARRFYKPGDRRATQAPSPAAARGPRPPQAPRAKWRLPPRAQVTRGRLPEAARGGRG